MSSENVMSIIEKFRGKKIIVVGDIMLDKYIWGDVSRISPEAPVQVVNVLKETYAPGGASNVANNSASLGAQVYIVGIIGNDEARKLLVEELNKRRIDTEGILVDNCKPTIQKVRIIARSQQLMRVDYESDEKCTEQIENNIVGFISSKIDEADGIIVSDYAKGVITAKTMSAIVKLCREKNKIAVVDPKPKHSSLYKGVTLITPNHHEASQMAGIEIENDDSISEIGFRLLNNLDTNVLITRGEKGMSLFDKNNTITHIPTKQKEVYNIIGAGDTVVAAVTLALVSGASLIDAAVIGNIAAGIKVGKIEEQTVSLEEIKDNLKNYA